MMILRRFSFLGILVALSCSAAMAQSCPLCRLALLNSPEGRRMISSFNAGILLMLAVPFFILLFFGAGFARMRWKSLAEAKQAIMNLFLSNPYFARRKALSGMVWGIALLMILIATVTNVVGAWVNSQSKKETALPVYGKVPGFTLTERSGKNFSSKSLAGKIWVADTIFTRCPDECPLLTNHMARLQEDFLKDPRVDFVSISVDPRYDRPEILTRYARHFHAKKGRWFFLTGDRKQIIPLIEKGFFLPIVQDPHETLSPNKPPDIEHSLKFVLVDSRGQIRGYYDGNEERSLPFLSRDITILEEAKAR